MEYGCRHVDQWHSPTRQRPSGRGGTMLMLVLILAVAATTGATVWLATTRPGRDGDPDAAFWYVFTGLSLLAPMILGPAMTNRVLSVVLLAVSAATALGVHAQLRQLRERRLAAAAQARIAAEAAETAAVHAALLSRWSRYELDPAAAIDFPSMNDVRIPETAALAKAVRTAARLQDAVHPAEPPTADDAVTAYRCAVVELAQALETAERAARLRSAA